MRKKKEAAFMDKDGRIWIDINTVIRLIKGEKKHIIKNYRKACAMYLQDVLNDGEDVDIRGTKRMWRKNMANICVAVDRITDGFEHVRDHIAETGEGLDER